MQKAGPAGELQLQQKSEPERRRTGTEFLLVQASVSGMTEYSSSKSNGTIFSVAS